MQVGRLFFSAVAVVGGGATLAAVVLAAGYGPAAGSLGWVLGGVAPLCLAGLFAYWRRPDHAGVRWLLATGSILGISTLCEYVLRLTGSTSGPAAWLLHVGLIVTLFAASAAGLLFFALFPLGRAERGYERVVVRATVVSAAVLPALLVVSRPVLGPVPPSIMDLPETRNPLFVPAFPALDDLLPGIDTWYWVLILPAAVAMVALRYRRAELTQRRQIRWLVLGLALGTLSSLPFAFGGVWLGGVLGTAGLVATTACILVALLDEGLLDVDVLIRESLVYGTLWLLIAGVYVGAAAALGLAASSQLPVSLAIAVTIAATLVFEPARRRLERTARRWVFGERISHYDVVTRFGDALEETGDLDEALPKLADTVRHGLGLRWARVRLDPPVDRPDLPLPEGRAGQGEDPELVVPLARAGEVVGAIECGPKRQGPFTEADRRLVATLAGQAATAAHNLRLRAEQTEHLSEISRRTAEVTASRARVVRVQDAERRRLQRDLHDGVQQSVAALSTRLGLARNQLRRSDEQAADTLAELQSDVLRLLDQLRDLAHRIRPAVLNDRGLLEAVEAQAARLPLPVLIDAGQELRGARFPDHIEDAAWFGIAEALTNTLKHAAAEHVVVALARQNSHLQVQVRDDGRGFDPACSAGFGLTALADRMAVLGGRLTLDSRLGSGTRVHMDIPLPRPDAEP